MVVDTKNNHTHAFFSDIPLTCGDLPIFTAFDRHSNPEQLIVYLIFIQLHNWWLKALFRDPAVTRLVDLGFKHTTLTTRLPHLCQASPSAMVQLFLLTWSVSVDYLYKRNYSWIGLWTSYILHAHSRLKWIWHLAQRSFCFNIYFILVINKVVFTACCLHHMFIIFACSVLEI